MKIFVKQIQENDAKVVGLPKERRQKARAALLNCISALVCQDTQESVALGRVLNPQCIPTGPSHSLHAHAVAALFACSHNICEQKGNSVRTQQHTLNGDRQRFRLILHSPVLILYFLLDILQRILGDVPL